MAVCSAFVLISLVKILSKIAKDAMKTTKGTKKTATDLKATEGPLVFSSCS